jgi:hypothetical protein
VLGRVQAPGQPEVPLFSEEEIERCAALIAVHDDWKLSRPGPATADRLGLCCLEGDALYPLHPVGVAADLERPGAKGHTSPEPWREQVGHSLQTLREYRCSVAPEQDFAGPEAIFRTREGYRLYANWLAFWGFALASPDA